MKTMIFGYAILQGCRSVGKGFVQRLVLLKRNDYNFNSFLSLTQVISRVVEEYREEEVIT
jgi:hypothetical protein